MFDFEDNEPKEEEKPQVQEAAIEPEKPDSSPVVEASAPEKEVAKPEKKAANKAKKAEPTVYSITHLNRVIKFTLSEIFPTKILVEGEISNFKRHGSGHLYFSLKDEGSSIAAAMWRSSVSSLKFAPENGMAVVATARLEVYEPQGKYQLIVDKLEPAGIGALELAFRQMAEKLKNEGLFDPETKNKLPRYPMAIGIVTSGTGAAVKDICQTLNRRWPFARKLLYPVAVQGPDAAGEITAAINDINKRRVELGGVDVMIVGRGGGSLEDLWPFNEEAVARAIYASEIPIISGVGHEIDTTIADLVADVRAATPTAAAELAVPVAEEELLDMHEYARTITFDMRARLKQANDAIEGLIGRPFFSNPMSMLDVPRQSLDETQTRLAHAVAAKAARERRELDRYEDILKQIEPHSRIGRLKLELENARHRLDRMIKNAIDMRAKALDGYNLRMERRSPMNNIKMARQGLNHYAGNLHNAIKKSIVENTKEMEQYRKLLSSVDHRKVLKRGYSLTRDEKGKVIDSVYNVKAGERIKTELADGCINSIIESEE